MPRATRGSITWRRVTEHIVGLVAGLLMILIGGATWGIVSSQLSDQRITVAEDASFVVVIAYGVAALVIGLGVLVAGNGYALTRIAAGSTVREPERAPEPATA